MLVPTADAKVLTHGGWGYARGYRQSIFLDEVQCNGTEDRIFDCDANPIGRHDCTHSEDVGVRCRLPALGDIDLGDIRLQLQAEWKSSTARLGELCVMILGQQMMQKLLAGSLDFQL